MISWVQKIYLVLKVLIIIFLNVLKINILQIMENLLHKTDIIKYFEEKFSINLMKYLSKIKDLKKKNLSKS